MNDDMMKNLGNMLQNNQIPDELKNMINNFSKNKSDENSTSPNHSSNSNSFDSVFESIKNSSSNSQTEKNSDSSNPFSNLDIGTIMKIKSIMDSFSNPQDDPRSNLLLSLKPYLKPSRKEKVDQYIKIFGMTQIFDKLGGEQK